MSADKTRRLHKRSSKQTRADDHAVAKTNPGPLKHPSTSSTSASVAQPEVQATSRGCLGCPDRIYLLASVIFQNVHPEKPASEMVVNYGNKRRLPLPEVKSEERHTAYELAFNTLKYQGFLEAVIIDSFGVAPPMSNDNMSLFLVVLYDFLNRKFPPRQREKVESIPAVALVEKLILGFKTKLAASVARHRIKHQLLSVECFLPETVKIKQERLGRLPIYAWVNTLKSSPGEIHRVLTSSGFCQVRSIKQLVDMTFCWDRHCGDMLVFPAGCRSQLHSTKLLSDRKLVIQDKSCGLGPNAVFSLLPDDADVLLAGRFSSLTVSHTAALIAKKSSSYSRQQPRVYVCVGDHTDAQRAELQQTVTDMGCKNVMLVPEDFQSLAGNDKRLWALRVILLNPKCSLSAVSDPVEIILQENRDPDLLRDLSQGSIGPKKLTDLVVEQRKAVSHALMFPQVLAVVYSTYSSHAEENEEVVEGELEILKANLEQAGEPQVASFGLSPSPFKVVKEGDVLEKKDNFFMLEPSEESNGCFLAVLKRELEPMVKETPREVILRAYAAGILDGIGSNHLIKTMRQNHGSILKQQHQLGSESGAVVPTRTKTPKTKRSWGVTWGHHAMSHTKASQAKTKQQTAKTSKDTPPTAAAPPRQNNNASSPSSSKLDSSSIKKRLSTLLPAALPATDAGPAVRPHLDPKQVLLTLPAVHFQPLRFHSSGGNLSQKEPPSDFTPSKKDSW